MPIVLPKPLASVVWLFDFDPTTGSGVAALPYAFGVRTDDDTLWFHIGVAPTAWIKVSGSGGGGGSMVQSFTYVVTGDEPDLSELSITLPTPIFASYVAAPVEIDCAGVVGVLVSARTPTGFVLSGTGKFTAGDTIGFLVNPLT